MANIFTWSTKDAKLVDKRLREEQKMWLLQEQDYDKNNGFDPVTCKQLWPNRDILALIDEFNQYVAPGRREIIETQVRAESMRLMERAWEYQHMLKVAQQTVAERLGLENATKTFFITVRPANVEFPTFYAKVSSYSKRKCFVEYNLSFEQKGQSVETLGEGFHFHMVATCKQSSKGEVLRDALSTFNGMAAPNCIDVAVCKNPKEHTQRYLIDYVSNDEHKECTKEWDAQWRTNMGLLPLYTQDDAMAPKLKLPIKSNRQFIFTVEEPVDA